MNYQMRPKGMEIGTEADMVLHHILINCNHQTFPLTNSAFHSQFSFLIDIFLVVQQESEKCKVCSFFLVF